MERIGDPTQIRWRRFGDALAKALADSGMKQKVLADEIGISTSTLSDWKLGRYEPERAELTFALERALKLPAGELSQHLGYVPVSAASSWEAALGLDPEIDERLREVILAVVRTMKKTH